MKPAKPKSDAEASIETSQKAKLSETKPEGDAKLRSLPAELGRYRIVKQLGEGGMGSVFLAHDTDLDRQVALKIPKFESGADEQILSRFYREARAAAKLRHINICPVHDVGEIDGTHFICMAHIEGRPLSAYIHGGRVQSQRQAVLVVRKLALALNEAHELGILHRDLKPDNVMIDHRKEPVIMDFGLAGHLDHQQNTRLTQQGTCMGSPAYMSPEQVAGEVDKFGPATDIYSLGVILFELLTGRLPFEGPVTAVLGQIMTRQAPSPSEFRKDLDPKLTCICERMMARRIEDRYSSMNQVADALAEYLRDPNKNRPENTASTSIDLEGAEEPTDSSEMFDANAPALPRVAVPSLHKRKPKTTGFAWLKKIPPKTLGISAASVVVLGLLLAGVMFVFRTPYGVVTVKLDDENLKLAVDGNQFTVSQLNQPLRLAAGDHQFSVAIGNQQIPVGQTVSLSTGHDDGAYRLRVTLDNVDLTSDHFEIFKDGKQVLSVMLESQGSVPTNATVPETADASESSTPPVENEIASPRTIISTDRGRSVGFQIHEPIPIQQFADYTNILFIHVAFDGKYKDDAGELSDSPDIPQWNKDAIRDATERGLKIVLACGMMNEDPVKAVQPVIALARRYEEQVLAVCINDPYLNGIRQPDLATAAKQLKMLLPNTEVWVQYCLWVNGSGEQPVPDEVDTVLLRPGRQQESFREDFANRYSHWKDAIGSRSKMIFFCNQMGAKSPRGNASDTSPNDFDQLQKVAEENQFQGIIFDSYGRGYTAATEGIETKPALIDRVKSIASDWKAESRATVAAPADSLATERLIGFQIQEPAPIRQLAEFTNILFIFIGDQGSYRTIAGQLSESPNAPQWIEESIQEAVSHGLRVVLTVGTGGDPLNAVQIAIALARRYEQHVHAICIMDPYLDGSSQTDLAAATQLLETSLPNTEVWVQYSLWRPQDSELPVPDAVDTVLLRPFSFREGFRQGFDDQYAQWKDVIGSRPRMIFFSNQMGPRSPRGMVPIASPTDFDMLRDIAQERQFKGIIFDSYGRGYLPETEGIETKPELVDSIKAISDDWGTKLQ